MTLKHFKKTLIMNNKWLRTCNALKGLLDILSCSKCKKSLHNPQQFLVCGHFSCISCINNNNSKCIQCDLPCGSDGIIKDETIKKIVQACCSIAQEVGFGQRIENTETKVPLAKNLNKHLNNLKKRKIITNNNNEFSKKTKCNKQESTFRVPKNIDKKNHHGETKLQEECKKGHIENVKILLAAGANPNICCNAGWTPLQECADFGYYEIAKLLLDAKVSVNQPGCDDRTPLHEAAKNNDYAMVKLLLDHGAERDVIDTNGNRPVDDCQEEKIKELLNQEVKCLRSTKKNKNILVDNETSISGESGSNETSHLKRITRSNNFEIKQEKMSNPKSTLKKENNNDNKNNKSISDESQNLKNNNTSTISSDNEINSINRIKCNSTSEAQRKSLLNSKSTFKKEHDSENTLEKDKSISKENQRPKNIDAIITPSACAYNSNNEASTSGRATCTYDNFPQVNKCKEISNFKNNFKNDNESDSDDEIQMIAMFPRIATTSIRRPEKILYNASQESLDVTNVDNTKVNINNISNYNTLQESINYSAYSNLSINNTQRSIGVVNTRDFENSNVVNNNKLCLSSQSNNINDIITDSEEFIDVIN